MRVLPRGAPVSARVRRDVDCVPIHHGEDVYDLHYARPRVVPLAYARHAGQWFGLYCRTHERWHFSLDHVPPAVATQARVILREAV